MPRYFLALRRKGQTVAYATEKDTWECGERREFNERHAALAARLFHESGRRRGTLIDCMIAAVAIEDESPIATANVHDFQRFESAGLVVLPRS
jgi:predicted nucleic acid-binding protein